MQLTRVLCKVKFFLFFVAYVRTRQSDIKWFRFDKIWFQLNWQRSPYELHSRVTSCTFIYLQILQSIFTQQNPYWRETKTAKILHFKILSILPFHARSSTDCRNTRKILKIFTPEIKNTRGTIHAVATESIRLKKMRKTKRSKTYAMHSTRGSAKD